MNVSVEPAANLFAEKLPSIKEIRRLSEIVHSSESNLLAFSKQVEPHLADTSPQALLATGIGVYILGRNAEAVERLEKAADCKEKFMYLGYAYRRLAEFTKAIEGLQKSVDLGADPLSISLEKAATYRHAKDYEACEKELEGCANYKKVSAEYHYQLGRVQEMQGLYEAATDNYRTTMELSPDHNRAIFHLAYRCDLAGDESAAIDYYLQITSRSPVYVSALMNLAVLYEDAGQFEKAVQYVDLVLECHPNHQRAILFKKDTESSKTMFYDEEKEKKKTRKNQILETPISDFELSVRSRNCLKKMSIQTIGDLLNITEQELLSYKNFGETSLREIKAILDTKNLRLGMAIEEKQLAALEGGVEGITSVEDEGLMNKPVDDLNLSVRSRKCLTKLEIHNIGQLTRTTEAELLGCKNFGVTSLNEIKKAVGNLGLSLRSLD